MNKHTALLRAIQAAGLVTRSAPDPVAKLAAINERAAGKVIHRAAEVVEIDEEARTVNLAFSSEQPVERWWGEETLSHNPAHVRMGRLNDGGALLWNHDWDDQRGVIEQAQIHGDRRGRATVRFSRTEEGEKLWLDVKDKIKRHVSVGYFIHALQLTEIVDGYERWLVTDWEPYEISIVSVPADTSVGVGRTAEITQVDQAARTPETGNLSNPQKQPESRNNTPMKIKTLRNAAGDLVRARVDDDDNIVEVLEVIEQAGDGTRSHVQRGADAERTRMREINALAERFGRAVPTATTLALAAINEGRTPSEFQGELLAAADARISAPLNDQNAAADIGLTDAEVGQFSLMRVAAALADPGNRSLRNAAAMEFRASEAAAQAYGRSGERFVVPADVLRRAVGGDFSRIMSTSTSNGGNGGVLVDTTLQTGSFIDMLRNRAVLLRNSRVIGGLVGNIDIPKQTAGSTGYWIGEGQDTSETGVALGMISLKPKTIGAHTDITRRMLMQSSMDVEALLRADLALAIALQIDKAGFYGSGSEFMPRGLANYDGINAVALTGDYPTYAEAVAMETQVSLDNADVASMRFVGNASLRGHAKTTLKFEAAGSATLWEPGNAINGYGADITNQVNAGDTFFGNWDDLVVAMWGGLELTTDMAALAASGGTRLRVFQDIDLGLRRVESFCLARRA